MTSPGKTAHMYTSAMMFVRLSARRLAPTPQYNVTWMSELSSLSAVRLITKRESSSVVIRRYCAHQDKKWCQHLTLHTHTLPGCLSRQTCLGQHDGHLDERLVAPPD